MTDLQNEVDGFLEYRQFEIGPKGICRYLVDADGNQFVYDSLCSEGVKKEGHKPYTFASEESAVEAYLESLKRYCYSWPNGYTVYWRELPSMKANESGYYVYSRLLISKPGLATEEHSSMTQHAPESGPAYLEPGWRTPNKGPNPENKSGFRATGHRVLLDVEEVEETTESGIVLMKKTVVAEANRAVICTVLEIGPDAWADKSTDYCEVGDRVLVGLYTGKFHDSPVDGKTYRFVSDLDIISPLPKVEK